MLCFVCLQINIRTFSNKSKTNAQFITCFFIKRITNCSTFITLKDTFFSSLNLFITIRVFCVCLYVCGSQNSILRLKWLLWSPEIPQLPGKCYQLSLSRPQNMFLVLVVHDYSQTYLIKPVKNKYLSCQQSLPCVRCRMY